VTIRVGELDHRVKILREIRTPDGSGGHTSEWSLLRSVWAKKMDTGASKVTDFDRVNSVGRTVWHIRSNNVDVLEDDILEHVRSGIRYNIRGVNHTAERRGYIELDTERGVAV
jgi:head-tail adaptor